MSERDLSVHLILRRAFEGLDGVAELRVNGFRKVEVEAQPCGDLLLRLQVSVRPDSKGVGDADQLEQAAEVVHSEGAVDHNGRRLIGIDEGTGCHRDGLNARRQCVGGIGLGRVVGQGLSPGYADRRQDNLIGQGASSARAVA